MGKDIDTVVANGPWLGRSREEQRLGASAVKIPCEIGIPENGGGGGSRNRPSEDG